MVSRLTILPAEISSRTAAYHPLNFTQFIHMAAHIVIIASTQDVFVDVFLEIVDIHRSHPFLKRKILIGCIRFLEVQKSVFFSLFPRDAVRSSTGSVADYKEKIFVTGIVKYSFDCHCNISHSLNWLKNDSIPTIILIFRITDIGCIFTRTYLNDVALFQQGSQRYFYCSLADVWAFF